MRRTTSARRSSPLSRDGIADAGRTAVETGRGWNKGAGPLLVVLTPAA
ncbi:hypothetical protein [Streptomyces sp. NPDC088812]